VTIWSNRPNTVPDTYLVEVITAADKFSILETFVHAQYPKSSVTVIGVPTSFKAIVRGTATSQWERNQILKVIEDSGLRKCDIICELAVPCCCRTCRR
jgi:hypothetical protein